MSITPHPGSLPHHTEQTVDDLQQMIREQELALKEMKCAVNALLAAYNHPPLYEDLDVKVVAATGPVRRDQFYGQPLASVVREVLTRRRAANLGPASVAEIFDAMVEGGYPFDAKDGENAKRGLRISLAKNTATFHKLPTGHYGLKEWYPNAKEPKSKATQSAESNGQAESEGAEHNPVGSPKQMFPDVNEDMDPFDFEAKQKKLKEAARQQIPV